MRLKWILTLGILGTLLAACTASKTPLAPMVTVSPEAVIPTLIPPVASPTVTSPTIELPTAAPLPTQQLQTTPTTGQNTSISTATSTPVSVTADGITTLDVDGSKYIDDRSGVQILASLFNAINRKEYLRAYSYWSSDSSVGQSSFAQYESGYSQTSAVQAQIGPMVSDAGAGNYYTSVPVALTVSTATGTTQYFAGCYTFHQAAPANFGSPPFQPIDIKSASVKTAASAADLSAMLKNACDTVEGSPVSMQPAPAADDISADRFLDDRSDALQVIRSYYNAINRHEYVRAYSYWEPAAAAQELPSYNQFEQGYADTASVELTTGEISGDAGAGQYDYSVPVALQATLTSGSTQTYVGCYTLHLSNPNAQGVPPFKPLDIRSADLKKLATGADITQTLNQACQP